MKKGCFFFFYCHSKVRVVKGGVSVTKDVLSKVLLEIAANNLIREEM